MDSACGRSFAAGPGAALPPAADSPADELKAKLAATKEPEPEPAPEGVDERRADTHARARHAIEELREKRD